MTTIITATVPAGNFDTVQEARAYAATLELIARREYPGGEVSITVVDNQTGGGSTTVVIDGDEDERSAEALNFLAARELS